MLKLEIISQSPATNTKRKPVSILFVHGVYHAAWAFRDTLMPFLAGRGFECGALSLRGHGASEGREILKDARFDDYLEDVRSAIRQIRGPLVLAGHSSGGQLVRRHLESQSQAGAIFICAPTGRDLRSARLRYLKSFPRQILKAALTGNPDHFYHDRDVCRAVLFNGDRSPETEKAIGLLVQESESRKIFKDLLTFESTAPKSPIPTLVIGGAGDLSVAQDSLKNLAETYGGELKIYANQSHELILTPGWMTLAQDIADWLDRAVCANLL